MGASLVGEQAVVRNGNVPRRKSQMGRALSLYARNWGAVFGVGLVVVVLVLGIFAPWVAPYDPLEVVDTASQLPPSSEHWMGTDLLGRDILSRVIYGARLSLLIGVVAVVIGATFGIMIGLVAGYYGGQTEAFLMRIVDAMLAFPGMLLAMTVVAALGPDLQNAILAVGISSIPVYARLTNGVVLSAKQNVYVEAARSCGCSTLRIMLVHILPNVAAPIVIVSTLRYGTAVLSVASLSFLGLGAQPPTPEWGLMVSMGRPYLAKAWWMSTFPGLTITAVVVAVNLLGDGLREALDPKLRYR